MNRKVKVVLMWGLLLGLLVVVLLRREHEDKPMAGYWLEVIGHFHQR